MRGYSWGHLTAAFQNHNFVVNNFHFQRGFLLRDSVCNLLIAEKYLSEKQVAVAEDEMMMARDPPSFQMGQISCEDLVQKFYLPSLIAFEDLLLVQKFYLPLLISCEDLLMAEEFQLPSLIKLDGSPQVLTSMIYDEERWTFDEDPPLMKLTTDASPPHQTDKSFCQEMMMTEEDPPLLPLMVQAADDGLPF